MQKVPDKLPRSEDGAESMGDQGARGHRRREMLRERTLLSFKCSAECWSAQMCEETTRGQEKKQRGLEGTVPEAHWIEAVPISKARKSYFSWRIKHTEKK